MRWCVEKGDVLGLTPYNVLYACCIFHDVFLCCIKFSLLWYCGILCYIFPHVEGALVLWNFVLYFTACAAYVLYRVVKINQLNIKNICVFFSVCGTRYGILCCIFLHVGRALVFCVVFFFV